MITKELFIEIIKTIQEQSNAETEFCNAFSKYANSGEYPPIITNRLLSPLIKLLEATIDPNGTIDWWLFDIDEGHKFAYDTIGEDEIEYDLNDINDLYEYVMGNYNAVKSKRYKSNHKKRQGSTKSMTMGELQTLLEEKIKNNK